MITLVHLTLRPPNIRDACRNRTRTLPTRVASVKAELLAASFDELRILAHGAPFHSKSGAEPPHSKRQAPISGFLRNRLRTVQSFAGSSWVQASSSRSGFGLSHCRNIEELRRVCVFMLRTMALLENGRPVQFADRARRKSSREFQARENIAKDQRKGSHVAGRHPPGATPVPIDRSRTDSQSGRRTFRRVWIAGKTGASFEQKRLMRMTHHSLGWP